MNVKPVSNNVLVEVTEIDQISKGGIHLLSTTQEKTQKGKVVEVGPGKTTDEGVKIPLEVAIGDKVFFIRHIGTELEIDSVKYVMLKDTDILATI